MMFRRFYSFLLFFAPVLSVALFAQSAPFEEKGVSEHQWTWGIGGANVLDTYLSRWNMWVPTLPSLTARSDLHAGERET